MLSIALNRVKYVSEVLNKLLFRPVISVGLYRRLPAFDRECLCVRYLSRICCHIENRRLIDSKDSAIMDTNVIDASPIQNCWNIRGTREIPRRLESGSPIPSILTSDG